MARQPSEVEYTEICDAIKQWDADHKWAYIEPREVAIIDNYMSDGPGYSGPIAFVVFGEPHYICVLTKAIPRDGPLIRPQWHVDIVTGDDDLQS